MTSQEFYSVMTLSLISWTSALYPSVCTSRLDVATFETETYKLKRKVNNIEHTHSHTHLYISVTKTDNHDKAGNNRRPFGKIGTAEDD